jgi:hypothetical protein
MGGWLSHAAVETDPNILAIARAAIAGSDRTQPETIDERANDHVRAGELETAEMASLAAAVRDIFAGLPSRPATLPKSAISRADRSLPC